MPCSMIVGLVWSRLWRTRASGRAARPTSRRSPSPIGSDWAATPGCAARRRRSGSGPCQRDIITAAVAALRADARSRPSTVRRSPRRARARRSGRPGLGRRLRHGGARRTRASTSPPRRSIDVLAQRRRAAARRRGRLSPRPARRGARRAHAAPAWSRAARVLVPKDPFAGLAGVALLVLAPPFRDAAVADAVAARRMRCRVVARLRPGTASPRSPRAPSSSVARRGSASCARSRSPLRTPREDLPLGARPRSASPPSRAGSARPAACPLDRLPRCRRSRSPARGAARSSSAPACSRVGFGARDRACRARAMLAVFAVLAALHDCVFGGSAATLLAVLAIAIAIIPAAIARAREPRARDLVAARRASRSSRSRCSPGAPIRTDDRPGAAPTRFATDLDAPTCPPAPACSSRHARRRGSRSTTRGRRRRATRISRSSRRCPRTRPTRSSRRSAPRRAHRRVRRRRVRPPRSSARHPSRPWLPARRRSADAPPRRSRHPRSYASAIGAEEAAMLAVERARHEAASGRLDMAARAAGLADRVQRRRPRHARGDHAVARAPRAVRLPPARRRATRPVAARPVRRRPRVGRGPRRATRSTSRCRASSMRCGAMCSPESASPTIRQSPRSAHARSPRRKRCYGSERQPRH